MKLQPATGGDFTPAPAGAHRAVCVRFIDLGTQKTEWKGETKHSHKVLVAWELTDELEDFDGEQKPFLVVKRYTWSMHEKANMRHDLENWRGKKFTDADFGPDGFDTKNLLGVPALVTVTHDESNGKTYANVTSVSPLPKGMEKPAPINPLVYFTLERDGFEQATFDTFTDRMKAIISETPEYHELHPARGEYQDRNAVNPPATDADLDDEIPF